MKKMTAKNRIKPELASIYMTPTTMTATDAHRLLEVKKDISGVDEPVMLFMDAFDGKGDVMVTPTYVKDGKNIRSYEKVDGEYPKYDKIFDQNSSSKFEIRFNPKLLGELLMEMAKHEGKAPNVTIKFIDTNRPLVIEGTKTRALCMPLYTA